MSYTHIVLRVNVDASAGGHTGRKVTQTEMMSVQKRYYYHLTIKLEYFVLYIYVYVQLYIYTHVQLYTKFIIESRKSEFRTFQSLAEANTHWQVLETPIGKIRRALGVSRRQVSLQTQHRTA